MRQSNDQRTTDLIHQLRLLASDTDTPLNAACVLSFAAQEFEDMREYLPGGTAYPRDSMGSTAMSGGAVMDAAPADRKKKGKAAPKDPCPTTGGRHRYKDGACACGKAKAASSEDVVLE